MSHLAMPHMPDPVCAVRMDLMSANSIRAPHGPTIFGSIKMTMMRARQVRGRETNHYRSYQN
jgi:hypothetical protein